MIEEVLLLKSLAYNYPILSEWNLKFPKLITVVVEPGNAVGVASMLKNFKGCDHKNSDFQCILQNDCAKSKFMSNKYHENLLENTYIEGLQILITDCPFIEEYNISQFYVFLDEEDSMPLFDFKAFVPPSPDCLKNIYECVCNCKASIESKEELSLVAAGLFVQSDVVGITQDDVLKAAKSICQKDEETHDTRDIREEFSEYMYSWQKRNSFNLFKLEEMYKQDNKDSCVFYDDKFLYMSSTFFKEMVTPIINFIPITVLKTKLLEAEVIIADPGTYTTKITVKNKDEVVQRIRMIKIQQNSINKAGAMAFVDRCLIQQEDR